MFGLSLGKVLFTAVVVVVVWGAFKYYSRAVGGRTPGDRPSLRERVEKAAEDAVRKRMDERGHGTAPPPAEDLVRCPNCGAWHAKGAACDCGYGR
ncbi:hypothetical protein [Rhodospira trueperi]|uniref:Uncharacterized protein n=1 Tax=Rhodospira trueperi TaxID=69960 RepID=A0A1G7B0S8_9PROT|nr:hypothetical protein [Rhodospira trueperi]SDE20689.1 hypothetical protein SAMN05421720_104179 [Rhodospira trueperi]